MATNIVFDHRQGGERVAAQSHRTNRLYSWVELETVLNPKILNTSQLNSDCFSVHHAQSQTVIFFNQLQTTKINHTGKPKPCNPVQPASLDHLIMW